MLIKFMGLFLSFFVSLKSPKNGFKNEIKILSMCRFFPLKIVVTMWQLQILLILSIFYIQSIFCKNEETYTSNRCLNILNDTHRDLIIDEHNILRSQIINGKSNIKKGIKAPKGKNMYKLVCVFFTFFQGFLNFLN